MRKADWSTDDGSVALYLGDARQILPHLEKVDTILTAPVWPNFHPDLEGSGDPYGLWRDTVAVLPETSRLCVWLGCQSDPRFLLSVPEGLPFLRMCYMSRAVPSYNGRCLVTGDVLYCFGEWPAARKGRSVLPGECRVTSKPQLRQDHPCARNLEHAAWAVKWWTDPGETVLDCFMGTATIGIPCVRTERRYIGVESDPKHFASAVRRIELEMARSPLFEKPPAVQRNLLEESA